jgi:hypothetical protein
MDDSIAPSLPIPSRVTTLTTGSLPSTADLGEAIFTFPLSSDIRSALAPAPARRGRSGSRAKKRELVPVPQPVSPGATPVGKW